MSCESGSSACSGWARAPSTIGDRIVFVALALYVTEIGSPTDVGIVLAAHAFPLVAFLLLGGVWADRLPRHRVMVATDLIRFAPHALLAALIFTGAVEIWQHRRHRGGVRRRGGVLPPGLHRAWCRRPCPRT